MTKYGLNVSATAVSYDASSLQYADLIKGGTALGNWKVAAPPLDVNGWPLYVDSTIGQGWGILALNSGVNIPGGNLTIRYQGAGELAFYGLSGPNQLIALDDSTSPTPVAQKTVVINAQNNTGWNWQWAFNSSSKSNPLRNVQILIPQATTSRWNPDFLATLAPFSCLRFMDWLSTNNSNVVNFADFMPKGYTVNASGRYPLDDIYSLCNETKKACWLNIPHMATDACIQSLAADADKKLAAGIPLYIEYSNEIWNDGFSQKQWIVAQHINDPALAGKSWFYILGYAQCRAVNLFKSAITSGRPVVRVLGSQAAYYAVTTDQLQAMTDFHLPCDAVAIAPYFSPTFDGETVAAQYAIDPTVLGSAMDNLAAYVQTTLAWVQAQAGFAKAAGLPLLFYEAGQSMSFWTINDLTVKSQVGRLLFAMNRCPQMAQVYTTAIAGYQAAGVSLCNWYSDCGTWSQWGLWGHREFTVQNETTDPMPKWDTIQSAAMPVTPVGPPIPVPGPSPTPIPIPVKPTPFPVVNP